MISVVVLSVMFAATGVSLTEAIFGVMACISSCGVAFGGIGMEGEFVHISAAGKMVLALAPERILAYEQPLVKGSLRDEQADAGKLSETSICAFEKLTLVSVGVLS